MSQAAIVETNETVARFKERHYSVFELAEMWNLSSSKITDLFRDEPDVLVLVGSGRGRYKHRTLRIPEHVVERVHRKLSTKQ